MSRASDHRLIYVGLGSFLVASVLALGSAAMVVPAISTESGYPVSERAEPHPDGTFTATLDVSHGTEWVSYDLDAGRRVADPAGADLIVRRFWMRAPGGAIDLGEVPLAEARIAPDPAWVLDRPVDGIPQSAALAGWYRYSYLTHLLVSRGHTFAVRRVPSNGVAYVRFDSYYCEPEGTGCLTLRYRLEAEESP